MIEVVYNKKDEEVITNTNLKLPKNIRQIGSGSAKRRIYIEDYVMSYIGELAKKATNEKIVGVLLGENSVYQDSKYLFIKGTVKVKEHLFEEGRIVLTEKSWTGIYDDIKKYFPTLKILGWFVILDEVESLPKDSLEKTHVDNFAGNEKTLFLFETDKCEQGFYFYENGHLVKENGYYIYYERNEDMQEYMVCDEAVKPQEAPVMQAIVQEKNEQRDSKKLLSFMYSVSTFLVIVVLVMAINIMNSYEKLQNMESGIRDIGDRVVEVNGNVKETVPPTATQPQSQTEPQKQSETQSQTQRVTEEQTQQESTTEAQTKDVGVAAPTYDTYTISEGDSLLKISRRFYGSEDKVEAIMELNGIEDADTIYLGQEIKLP